MPQFCTLFYANYTILATQIYYPPWHHAPLPPKYAPVSHHLHQPVVQAATRSSLEREV